MHRFSANPSREMFSSKLELADIDAESRTFKGLAVRFNTVLNHIFFPTLFERGAFSRTLNTSSERSRVVLLQQHNPDVVLGKPTKLWESDRGLEIEGKISETQAGNDMITLMRDGVVDEMSIGIDPVKWAMERDSPMLKGNDTLRRMQDATLREVSLCVFAVDAGAKVEEVNSITGLTGLNILSGECPKWDVVAAEHRVREWATGEDGELDLEKYSQAFLWNRAGDYRLQIADVVDGKLTAIDKAIFSTGSLLSTPRVHNMFSPAEIGALQRHVGHYYHALNRSAPWERQPSVLLDILEPVLSLPIPDLGGETSEVLNDNYKVDIMEAVETLTELVGGETSENGGGDNKLSDRSDESIESGESGDGFDPDGEIADAELAMADLEMGD